MLFYIKKSPGISLKLNYKNKYIEIAKNTILESIDKEKTSVFLFGSRADNTFTDDSDLDIGLLSDEKIDLLLFHKIREKLEKSVVPYHIDLVDLRRTDEEFRNIALDNAVIWNKGKNFS